MLDLLEAAEALIYSDPAGALALASRAAADPTLRVRADTVRAVALARTGELVQSVGLGTRVLQELQEPQDRARLMNVLGAARDLLGQTAVAVEVFERALTLRPEPDLEAKLRVNLGVALARLDRHEPAIEHLQVAAALSTDPARLARIQLDMAISERALGDLAAAGASLDEASCSFIQAPRGPGSGPADPGGQLVLRVPARAPRGRFRPSRLHLGLARKGRPCTSRERPSSSPGPPRVWVAEWRSRWLATTATWS